MNAVAHLGPDLVVRLADGRAEHRDDRSRFAPSLFHRADRRLRRRRQGAPRQPECAAPMTRAFASAKRIGPQSAVLTPSATPGWLVTIASAFGPMPGAQTLVTTVTLVP